LVNKNVSIGVATSPGPIVEVAGRTGQKPPASSTKQPKKHTSAPPQAEPGAATAPNYVPLAGSHFTRVRAWPGAGLAGLAGL